MTPAILRAIGKIAAKRKPCENCGFPLPKYPGRYPSKCPHCSTSLLPSPPVTTAEDEED